MGLLMELGPCNIDMHNRSSNGTTWNPYSWNNEANIFFLDQPYVRTTSIPIMSLPLALNILVGSESVFRTRITGKL